MLLDLIAILLSGLATFIERVIFLITKKVRPPRRSLRYLPLVGPAVLGAIALPGLIAPRGEISLAETVPAVLAAIVAGLLWKWSKQLVVGLAGGLLMWWGLIFALVQWGLLSRWVAAAVARFGTRSVDGRRPASRINVAALGV